MKTLLLAAAFMLSINLANAQEHVHAKKHKNQPKAKIVYSENKTKPNFNKKKTPKKYMFAGEGKVNGGNRYR